MGGTLQGEDEYGKYIKEGNAAHHHHRNNGAGAVNICDQGHTENGDTAAVSRLNKSAYHVAVF